MCRYPTPHFGICLALAVLFFSVQLVSAAHPAQTGRIDVRTVDGASLTGNSLGIATERRVSIYLPPSYEQDSERSYPVLYVLHGIMDSDTHWTEPWAPDAEGYATIQDLMDRGVADGRMAEMIVVIPDSEKTCHYTNSPLKGNWEDFLRTDLVRFVDREYRTLTSAASRGIAGHSMGGHGAIKLGMKYPETFSTVYGLNPSLLGWGGDVSKDNPTFAGLAQIKTAADLQTAHFYIQALAGVGQCFSPNPDSPFQTDFPFAVREGQLVHSSLGYEAWQSQMPLYMIDSYIENLEALRGLRFDTAFEDEFTHIPITSRAFSQALARHDIEHHFEMYNGDHRNRIWGRGGRMDSEVLPYFSRLLADGIGAGGTQALPDDAPPSSPSPKVQAKLWKAAINGDLELARKALDAGAEVDALDTRTSQSGRRALNWAALGNHVAVIRLLAERGAKINLANNTGFTPLHHAAEAGASEAARLLIEFGADPTAENRFGHTPAATAEHHGHGSITSLLADR